LVDGGDRNKARQHLDDLLDDLREAARLVTRGKNAITYRREAARWMKAKAVNLDESDPQKKRLLDDAETLLKEASALE
jgi:hypothetical protein